MDQLHPASEKQLEVALDTDAINTANATATVSSDEDSDSDSDLGLALAMSMSQQRPQGAAAAIASGNATETAQNKDKKGMDDAEEKSIESNSIKLALESDAEETSKGTMLEEPECMDEDTQQRMLSRCVSLFREPLDMNVKDEVTSQVKPFSEVLEGLINNLRSARIVENTSSTSSESFPSSDNETVVEEV